MAYQLVAMHLDWVSGVLGYPWPPLNPAALFDGAQWQISYFAALGSNRSVALSAAELSRKDEILSRLSISEVAPPALGPFILLPVASAAAAIVVASLPTTTISSSQSPPSPVVSTRSSKKKPTPTAPTSKPHAQDRSHAHRHAAQRSIRPRSRCFRTTRTTQHRVPRQVAQPQGYVP